MRLAVSCIRAMTHDQQTVLAAYDDAIRKAYTALFEAYVVAGGNAAQEQQADQRFTAAVGIARKSRDSALALTA